MNKFSRISWIFISLISVFGCGAIFALKQSNTLMTDEETIRAWANICGTIQNAILLFVAFGGCLFVTLLSANKTAQIQKSWRKNGRTN